MWCCVFRSDGRAVDGWSVTRRACCLDVATASRPTDCHRSSSCVWEEADTWLLLVSYALDLLAHNQYLCVLFCVFLLQVTASTLATEWVVAWQAALIE